MLLARLRGGLSDRSIIVSGLRGVGKRRWRLNLRDENEILSHLGGGPPALTLASLHYSAWWHLHTSVRLSHGRRYA